VSAFEGNGDLKLLRKKNLSLELGRLGLLSFQPLVEKSLRLNKAFT